MFCPNCGFELDDDSRYCTECGYSLAAAKEVLSASDGGASEPKEEPAAAPDDSAEAPEVARAAGGQSDEAEGNPADGEEAPAGESAAEESAAAEALPSSEASVEPAEPPAPLGMATPAPMPSASQPAQPPAPAAKKKEHKLFYVLGILVCLVTIGVVGYQLFFNKAAGDVAHYGQDKAVVVIQESKITPTDSKGEKLKKYSVTLSGDNGYSANAEVKGDEGFTMSQFPEVKSGNYTLTVKDSKSKVEWTVPVKVVDNSKSDEAVKDVSLEVPKADESDAKTDEGDKKNEGDSSSNSAAYAAYKQKCQEYLAQYGEAQTVEIEDYISALRGFCLADLVDFDNDGAPELVTVVNDMSADDMKSAWSGNIEGLQKSYTVEVWSATDGGVKRLYSQNWLDNSNGGAMYLPLVKDDKKNVFIGRRTYEMCDALKSKLSNKQVIAGDNWSLYGKKDDSLALVLNCEAWSVSVPGSYPEEYYASNGKEISKEVFNSLNRYSDFDHQYCTYYFVDFSSSSQGTISDVPVVGRAQMGERTSKTLKKLGIE